MGAVVVVLLRRFDQRKAIDVTDIRLALASKQIEPTDSLLKNFLDLSCNLLLLGRQVHWVSDFLPLLVPLHDSVESRALPGFGMGVIGPYSIDFDVEAVRWKELFVYIGFLLPN